jgi:hypothetical protein
MCSSFRSITAAPRPGMWWIVATLGAALVATVYGIDQFIQSCETSCRLMHSGPFSWIEGLGEATWNGSFRAGVLLGLLLVSGHSLVLRPYLHQWRWMPLAALLSTGLGLPTALLAVLGVGGVDFHFLPLELLIVVIAIGIATGCGWAMSWCYSAALSLSRPQRRGWVWLQTTSWLVGWMLAGTAVLSVWMLAGTAVYVEQGARLQVGWVIMWTVIAGVTGLPVRHLAVGQNDA